VADRLSTWLRRGGRRENAPGALTQYGGQPYDPHQLLGLAIDVAEEGLDAAELPLDGFLATGDEVVGRAYTQERTLNRRLVHAELLALTEADQALGWGLRPEPMILAVTFEPCLMCLRAAMTMGVSEICYGRESPSDGAGRVGSEPFPT
jgi:tRNA(adenine34) deaminase